jgi:hypothetical protein
MERMLDGADAPVPRHPPASALCERSSPDGEHVLSGLWPGGEPAATLEEAQAALLGRVFSHLPPPPARVLLIGSPSGAGADMLAARGYAVTVVTARSLLAGEASRPRPDASSPPHGELDGAPLPGVFETAVLVAVGAELAPLGRLLGWTRELLAEGGVVALAGEVAGRASAAPGAATPPADEVTVALAENGFRPMERETWSSLVAPTCDAVLSRLAAARERARPAELEALDAATRAWAERREAYATGRLGFELVVARKDGYRMRGYRDGDEHEILPMFRAVFGVDRTLDHWRWKFLDNPYGARLVAETVTESGDLVAHFAGYPVRFHDSGAATEEFVAHQVGDTMTRPSVRQAGLGRQGILARISSYYFARFCREIPFVYGFNTGNVRKLGERYLGYTYVDPVGYWVRELASAPLPALGRVRRLLAGYSFAEISEAGGELDALFARVKGDYGLLIRRDAEYLGWRYLRCPDRVHRLLGVRHRGTLVGWCAFSRRGNDLVWGDALVEPRHAAVIPALLRECANGPFRGVERIWCWFSASPSWWLEVLAAAGFSRRQEPNDLTPCFVFFDDPGRKRELSERWYYTYGDSDLF